MSYLTFEKDFNQSAPRKTDVWDVLSARSGERLGFIRWYGPWRQYTFWPAPDTTWNPDCLREIALHCRGLTDAHRGAKARALH